jgi:hypothetical protein
MTHRDLQANRMTLCGGWLPRAQPGRTRRRPEMTPVIIRNGTRIHCADRGDGQPVGMGGGDPSAAKELRLRPHVGPG